MIFQDLVRADFAKSLCHGEWHTVLWHGNAKKMKKALQYMFEKMGGFQVQSYTLQAAGAVPSEGKVSFDTGFSEQDVDENFD